MTITEFKTEEITPENAVNWIKWLSQSFDWDTLCYYFGKVDQFKPKQVQQIRDVLCVTYCSDVNGYNPDVCLYDLTLPEHCNLITNEVKSLQTALNNRPFVLYTASDRKQF